MSKHLQKELEKIKKQILSLGAQVEDRLRLASKAIHSRELFDAERIIKTDYEIDEQEIEVEEECLKIMALHQPVAVDLRFLICTIKMNTDLERIADEAVNIAWKTKKIIQLGGGCDIVYDYSEMIEKVKGMLKKSLDAMVNLDVDIAFKVLILDDEIDKIYENFYDQFISDMKAHPEHSEYLLNMFWHSRHLERIADHTTNIAEEVIYLIEGEIVRHGHY